MQKPANFVPVSADLSGLFIRAVLLPSIPLPCLYVSMCCFKFTMTSGQSLIKNSEFVTDVPVLKLPCRL